MFYGLGDGEFRLSASLNILFEFIFCLKTLQLPELFAKINAVSESLTFNLKVLTIQDGAAIPTGNHFVRMPKDSTHSSL